MKTLFGRKFYNLEELREATMGALKLGQKGSDYIVTKEVELEEKEFKKFSNDFFEDQPWIEENKDGGYNKNGEIRCIRVTNKETKEKVLVNSEGYAYPRYTALETQ